MFIIINLACLIYLLHLLTLHFHLAYSYTLPGKYEFPQRQLGEASGIASAFR